MATATKFLIGIVLLCILGLQSTGATQELTKETFDELMVSGRNGMVKFYQPWCGHCKRVKPDWDILADTAHPSVFLGDVNCMVEKDLCAGHHTGNTWPTIMVYKRGKEELYTGGLGLEDLKTFVDETLAEPCNIGKLQESCNFKEKNFIAKWEGKGPVACRKEISRLSNMDTHSMTYDLKKWLRDRIRIIEQLSDLEASNDL